MKDLVVPPEAVEEARALAERRMTPEEWDAYVHAPMSDAEREEIVALYEWFTRRYPTPLERLASARRSVAQWTRTHSREATRPATPPSARPRRIRE